MIKDGGGRLVTEGGSIEGVGRIFQRAVEPGREQRQAGSTMLCGGESGVGGDHGGGSADCIEDDEDGKSTGH